MGFGKFWKVLESFGKFWKVLEGFGKFWKVLEGFGKFWKVIQFNNAIFQDLESCGKEKFLKMEKCRILVWENSKIS